MIDIEIAERMKNENNEQFNTLVRMHLSFELDLNTTDDDNEIPVNEKNKIKKLFKLYLHPKGCVTNSKSISPAIGGNIIGNNSNFAPTLSNEGIQQINQLIDFLMDEQNVCQEGIFRRTGSVTRQQELKLQIQSGKSFQLFNTKNIYSVHDCASVLKGILAELPEPLLTDMYFPVHCQIAELYKNTMRQMDGVRELRLLNSLQLLLQLLPNANYRLFKDIIKMLNHTIKFESNNKMSANSLATLFTPHIICPRKLTPEALHTMSQAMYGIISFMITKGLAIFEIPTKLSTDIRAYFIEQTRKRTMSPEQFLDESVTSDSTANTVYTFVDREKTAKAHDSNPTDTALAQLYAHIQSLPESSKKRKLIKQFNKENGQGTPLQFQISHRLKNSTNYTNINGNNNNNNNNNPTSSTSTNNTIGVKSAKSLGDSIKKHIFSRGPKTPKQQQQQQQQQRPILQTTNNNKNNQINDLIGGTTLKGKGTPSGIDSTSTTTTTTTPFDTPNNRRNINKNLKTRVLFQSPLYNINKSSESSSSPSPPPPPPKLLHQVPSTSMVTNSNDKLITKSQQNLLTQSNCSGIPMTNDMNTNRDDLIELINNNNNNGNDSILNNYCNEIDDCAVNSDHPIQLTINTQNFDLLKRKSLCKSESYLDNLIESNEMELIINETMTDNNQMDHQINNNNNNSNNNTNNNNDSNNKLSFTLKLRRAISLVNLGIPKMSFHKSIMKKSLSLQSKYFVKSSSPLISTSASLTLSSTSQQRRQQQQQQYQLSKDDRMCSPLTYQKIYDYNLITNHNNNNNNTNHSNFDNDHLNNNSNSSNSNSNNSSDNQIEINPINNNNNKTSPVSPITKSTQRMSRSMQESIMTPRCRKPVMFFSTIMGSSAEQQQQQQQHNHDHNNYQNTHSIFTSVRELDEQPQYSLTNEEDSDPSILNQMNNQSAAISSRSSGSSSVVTTQSQPTLLLYKSKSETDLLNDMHQYDNYNDNNDVFNMINAQKESSSITQLSQPFREYLCNRNVLMTSPVDSSFSSHPDDFGSNHDIQNLSETDMSESLLYCLNGNRPSMVTTDDSSSSLLSGVVDDERDAGQPPQLPSAAPTPVPSSFTNNLCYNNNNNTHIGIVDNLRKRHHTMDDDDDDDDKLLLTNKITDRLATTTAVTATVTTTTTTTTTTIVGGDEKIYGKKSAIHQHYSNHLNQHHIRHNHHQQHHHHHHHHHQHNNHQYLQSNKQQQQQQKRCDLNNSIGETSL